MVHPLLWPASTTVSSSSSPQTYTIPYYVQCGINLEKRLTGLAAVVVLRPLLIVGVRLAEDCMRSTKQSQTQSGYPGRLIISSLVLLQHRLLLLSSPHKKKMAALPQPPSFDEHLASLESLPLFMSSLPDDPTDNAALSALQSLAHDGTPDGWCVHLCVLLRPR